MALPSTTTRSQYTGNIRFIAKQTRNITPNDASIQTYNYDQAMRLKAMNTYIPVAGALSAWYIDGNNPAPLATNYKEANIT